MKKIIILLVSILALSVIFKSFSDNKKKESEKVEIIDTASLAYRVEEPHNLIVEEQANLVETEEEFTNYIATINEDVEFIVNKEIVTEKEKLTLKNTFITLTDFIFYGTEINGTTFEELTTSVKEEIISIYEQIDSKIEEIYPGYKETIKETTIKTYNNIKEELLVLKQEIETSYKNEIGEEKYEEQKAILEENLEIMEESFEPVIDKVIENTKEIYEATKEGLEHWYQTWKEANN